MFHVIKFGGTCVADPRSWPTIASEIEGRLRQGVRPVVVASALAGVSDRLEAYLGARGAGVRAQAELAEVLRPHRELARELRVRFDDALDRAEAGLRSLRFGESEEEFARARADGMAHGELLSTRLGARWLVERGIPIRWRDARTLLQAGAQPPGATPSQRFLSARCSHDPDPELVRALAGDRAVITQGFLARDDAGRTVLLGRGGSDTTASILAARLGASGIEFFSDVPGVFTADPREVPEARLIPSLGFDEAETLAALGARVLHPRSLRPLRSRGLPLRLRWIRAPELEGTIIGDPEPPDGLLGPLAIAVRSRLSLVECRRRHDAPPNGFLAEIAGCCRAHAVILDSIEDSPSRIRGTIDLAGDPDLPLRIPAFARELEALSEVSFRGGVASVSLVGRRTRSRLDRLRPVIERLRSRELLLLQRGADDRSLGWVVPREESSALVAELHAIFFEPGSPELGPRWMDLVGTGLHTSRAPLDTAAATVGEVRGG